MAWVFSDKRIRGSSYGPPRTLFYIGAICIGEILMHNNSGKWLFDLRLIGKEPETFETFSAAQTKLHKLLNSPPEE